MTATVVDLTHSNDLRDIVHRTVQALAEGCVVALPTETVYGLAARALDADAVAKLIALKGRSVGHPLTLAVKDAAEALDYAPCAVPLFERLARRCWPGLLTLVTEFCRERSLLRQLPPAVQTAVAPGPTIGMRSAAHQLVRDALELTVGPLVLTSANLTGEPPAISSEEVVASLAERVDLILAGGRTRYGQASSVVRVDRQRLTMLRQGAIDAQTLRHMASFVILLVCTGNTCRSPMAEVLLKQKLAKKLGVSPEELKARGVVVQSAGLAANPGSPAAAAAVTAMQQRGLDLSHHTSQPVTDHLLTTADLVLTMTNQHRQMLLALRPDMARRTFAICRDGSDVSDPIGGSLEQYQACAAQLDAELEGWMEKLGDDVIQFDVVDSEGDIKRCG